MAPPLPPYMPGISGPKINWPESGPAEGEPPPSRSPGGGSSGGGGNQGGKVEPASRPGNNPNHPGRGRGGSGGGSGSGGGGSGSSGSGGQGQDGFEVYDDKWKKFTGGRRTMLSAGLLGATITAYAAYHTTINAIIAAIGRSVLSAVLATAIRAGAFVGSRAVASSWLGPWGVAAVTVVSVIVFFAMSENTASAAQSPVEKYRREVNKLWQTYQNSSSPYAQLEALRKMFVVVYGMQLCLDAGIREQIYAGGKLYSTDPQKKQQMLAQYTQAVAAYKKAADNTGALLHQIIYSAERLLAALRTHYGWNQAMMNNVHAPYLRYFNHFKTEKASWDARRGAIKTDTRSVQNYLFNSRIG